VGDSGKIVATSNGGVTWAQQTSGVTNFLRCTHFVSNSVGWAVGDGGTILKFSTPTAIENNSSAVSMNVFPNPSCGNFTMNFTSEKSTTINYSVIDVTGKIIAAGKQFVLNGANEIHVTLPSDCDKGTYYIFVNTAEGKKSGQLIVVE
jgi:hypothetical protein